MSSGRVPEEWTPLEEGRVKLIFGRALEQGVQAWSTLMGGSVIASTWGTLRVSTQEPPVGTFAPTQGMYSVMTQIQGDLYGKAALCLSVPNAESLFDQMLQQSKALSFRGDPKVTAQSTLVEANNVFVNACLSGLSQYLKMELRAAAPKLEQGVWEKIWNKITVSQAASSHGRVLFAECTWSLAQKVAQFFLCLSPNSLEEVRQWAVRGKAIVTPVGIGALEFGSAPTVLKAADLGSCVALIMYDSQRKMGAMSHVMLPKTPTPERGKEKPGKYGDTAVPAMLKKFHPIPRKLSVWLAGGADMLIPFITTIGSIGAQNIEALHADLKRAGLKIMGEDIGGSQARTVDLLTETGELWIKCGLNQRRESL